MSKASNVLIVTPPMFLNTCPSESMSIKGFKCTICSGNGFNKGYGKENEWSNIKCPFCKGTGRVKAKVTIQWEAE